MEKKSRASRSRHRYGIRSSSSMGNQQYQHFRDDGDGAPQDKRWYHGPIDHWEAKNRLKNAPGVTDGTYLVYDNPKKEGEFFLLVFQKGSVHRFCIEQPAEGKFILCDRHNPSIVNRVEHSSVRELIRYHRGISGRPLHLEEGRGVLKLTDYVVMQS